MAEKKSYFRKRTVSEIKKLKLSEANERQGLVEKIAGLKLNESGLIIKSRILPDYAYVRRKGQSRILQANELKHIPESELEKLSMSEASLKFYKHGPQLYISQPKTLNEAHNSSDIPLYLRAFSFSEIAKRVNEGRLKEEDINFIGYSWIPVFGNDRKRRVVNFVDIPRGVAKVSYAENYSKYVENKQEKWGIKAKVYSDAARVRTEGSYACFEVPSGTEKRPRYLGALDHIPIIPERPDDEINYNLAIALSLAPAVSEKLSADDSELSEGRTPHAIYTNLQYKFKNQTGESKNVRFAPEEIAGYLGVIKEQMVNHQNITPFEFNVFALPSRLQMEFCKRMDNNVLIYDPSLDSKEKLRHLHLAEKSVLLARAIGVFGHDDFSYWDPTRDGTLKSYNWRV